MRAFTCPVCRHLVTFESTECLHCRSALAFDWDAREIVRLAGACANRELIACNGEGPPLGTKVPGLAPSEGLCAACLLTRILALSALYLGVSVVFLAIERFWRRRLGPR